MPSVETCDMLRSALLPKATRPPSPRWRTASLPLKGVFARLQGSVFAPILLAVTACLAFSPAQANCGFQISPSTTTVNCGTENLGQSVSCVTATFTVKSGDSCELATQSQMQTAATAAGSSVSNFDSVMVWLTGGAGNLSDFQIINSTCTYGLELSAGGSCSLTITFTPSTTETTTFTAALQYSGSQGATDGGALAVTATGAGSYTYGWAETAWEPTSGCGATTQMRTVSCLRSDGTTVDDSFCTGTEPATSQTASLTGTCLGTCVPNPTADQYCLLTPLQ